MLKLVNITKDYPVADGVVHALRGVTVNFRQSEFVAILGASGCGKTTLLNIIGGLDQYTEGDLLINGVSTKEYKDRDWDAYRNHSIGFVFQSYNLIPHQTVLANVELALTLSGVSRAERRARAREALERVGLGDQIDKLPRQLSGGQMQRVAIARALVNDPEILLADEPTGALDSVTSVQIMEILREISKDKLIIMVTHNPDLAEEYANRIIRAKDGLITDDSNPYDGEDTPAKAEAPALEAEASVATAPKKEERVKKRTSMSFLTALSLSFKNLMTKKVRTTMISLAGSIGIIGIALILSVSTGVQALIDGMEQSTMASYPLTIKETTMDIGSMLGAMMDSGVAVEKKEEGRVYSHNVVGQMLSSLASGIAKNDLKSLKVYLESGATDIDTLVNDIQYRYATRLNTFLEVKEDGLVSYKENMYDYYDLLEELGVMASGSGTTNDMSALMGTASATSSAWTEIVGGEEHLNSQYDILYGRLPTAADELVLFTNQNKEVSDFLLYMLGVLDVEQLRAYNEAAKAHREDPASNPAPDPLPTVSYTYEELCSLTFRYLSNVDYYTVDEVTGLVREKTETELKLSLDNAPTLKIVGILALAPDAVSSSAVGGIGYTEMLMPALIAKINENPIVQRQLADPTTDVKTGTPFRLYTLEDYPVLRMMLESSETYAGILQYVDIEDEEAVVKLANKYLHGGSTLEKNLEAFGVVDEASPSSILIYPKDFDSKDAINGILSDFGRMYGELTYTDTVAVMLSSITTIVNSISYVLVAFVAISLIVSSIMIGVITYISVLERIKEIGILRAMGASKKDISRVFNAETLVIGFSAGALGILISLILIVIINVILHALTGLSTLNAVLGLPAALILIVISMLLTFVAGLIPSGIAARRDPVVALRSE